MLELFISLKCLETLNDFVAYLKGDQRLNFCNEEKRTFMNKTTEIDLLFYCWIC